MGIARILHVVGKTGNEKEAMRYQKMTVVYRCYTSFSDAYGEHLMWEKCYLKRERKFEDLSVE